MAKEEMIDCHVMSSYLDEGEHVERGSNLVLPESKFKTLKAFGRVAEGPAPAGYAPAPVPAPDPGLDAWKKGKAKE